MKRNILVSLWMICSVAAFSQVTWNAKLGINISNWMGEGATDAKTGLKIGVGAEHAFQQDWSLVSGLCISQKGTKISSINTGEKLSLKCNQFYLELPVMGAYRFFFSDDLSLQLAAGPYFACGIGGKSTYQESEYGDIYTQEKYKTFGKDAFRRFDMGLGIGVTLEWNHYLFGVETQFGFIDLNEYIEQKNISSAITVGYKF
ncbi:MAG: PorT family protein [Bacteroides sp.]|nr:PorT family protein [Bacteroides sp.]